MSGAPPRLAQAVRDRGGRPEGQEIRFRCPYPDRHRNGDANPSARYHPERQVWCCDACGQGGGWRDLCRLLGIPLPRSTRRRSEVTVRYEYRDEEGTLLRRKLRWEPGFDGRRPKSFSWEKPDGEDGWTKCDGDGNPGVLYSSERLLAARLTEERVLVVEGEKDADCAATLGLVAVCNPEGAGTWQPAYSEQLRDLRVVVIADRDATGRSHAVAVAESLHGHAASVQVFEPPGEGVNDLSDWVADANRRGHKSAAIVAGLEDLLEAAPLFDAGTGEAQRDAAAAIIASLKELGDDPDLGQVGALLRELATATADLDQLSRELVRERAVRTLTGKVKAPGRLVDAALTDVGGEAAGSLQGRALLLNDPEPWPDPVDGAALLTDLEAVFRRFLVLVEGAPPALALWTLHTFTHGAAHISPLLALTSPEKRCGKTTVLALLTALTRRPLPASNITAAALFRAVERYEPTLLIDEADTFLRDREELRGILNSGHTRQTAYVIRTVGDEHEARCFTTWSPKAIAMIGRLPTTLEDRSIPIPMKRKAPGETVERLRLDRLGNFLDLKRRAFRWGMDHEAALTQADPDVPDGLHDRAADNWRPLLALADAAGGDWPAKARTAAQQLSAGEGGDSSVRVELLADVAAVFGSRETEVLFTDDLLADLTADESRPWGEWKRGKPLTAIGLARLLKPFGVTPRKVRIGDETRQGYRAEDLADALARYLPRVERPHSDPEHPEQVNNDKTFRRSPTRNNGPSVPARESAKPPATTGSVPGVPAQLPQAPPADPADREVFEV
jgi:putative DNA primase/helicase